MTKKSSLYLVGRIHLRLMIPHHTFHLPIHMLIEPLDQMRIEESLSRERPTH